MKLFEVQTNLTSYIYPLIKIIISIAIILLCIFRRRFLSIFSQWINTATSMISFVLVILCILVLYVSIGEVFHTFANRRCPHYDLSNTVAYTVNDLIAMAQSEDIIEIELLTTEGLLKVGASSDNHYVDSFFVDKRYYIGEREYQTIPDFAEALVSISSDNVLYVLSVDGISVK